MNLGKIAIIGGGHMGQALCKGLIDACGITPEAICVANPGAEKRASIEERYHVRTTASARGASPADTIILAVRPAVVLDVCRELADAGLPHNALVISVAAGVSTDSLTHALGQPNPIVRTMPNAPLAYGAGITGISAGATCPPNALETVRDMFEQLGGAVVVPEDQQDIVTAVSGSGPAYFELALAAIAQQAEELGMEGQAARRLALQTMHGTAIMLHKTQQDPTQALDVICTKGGTTEAALTAMRDAGVEEAFAAGVRAAAARSHELGI